MKPGTKCVKILDVASGIHWFYDPRSRCTTEEPTSYHAQSPYMALVSAFGRCVTLADVSPGEEIFLETADRMAFKSDDGSLVPGPVLWRKSKVVGPTTYQGKD